jgi:hypothetical protein
MNSLPFFLLAMTSTSRSSSELKLKLRNNQVESPEYDREEKRKENF